MFDMQDTGAKLAEARRAKDMTQMELAERLGISFQAVSITETVLPCGFHGISIQLPIHDDVKMESASFAYLKDNNVFGIAKAPPLPLAIEITQETLYSFLCLLL